MTRGAAARAIATLGGVGRFPFASGTAGTLAVLPLVVVAARTLPPAAFAAAAAACAAIAVWSAGAAAPGLGGHDPGAIVVDEAAGMFVTMVFLPVTVFTVCAGFLLFRAMDVLKPPPARQAERLPRGWGIVVDDLVAGLYANLLVRAAAAVVA